jgi:hypothetical protein
MHNTSSRVVVGLGGASFDPVWSGIFIEDTSQIEEVRQDNRVRLIKQHSMSCARNNSQRMGE